MHLSNAILVAVATLASAKPCNTTTAVSTIVTVKSPYSSMTASPSHNGTHQARPTLTKLSTGLNSTTKAPKTSKAPITKNPMPIADAKTGVPKNSSTTIYNAEVCPWGVECAKWVSDDNSIRKPQGKRQVLTASTVQEGRLQSGQMPRAEGQFASVSIAKRIEL